MSSIVSVESERLVLSAVLREERGQLAREVAAMLGNEDFFVDLHQNMWRCRQNLEDAGLAVNAAAVADMARRLRLDIGGSDYLVALMRDEVLSSASDAAVREAAARIKELSTRRQLIQELESALGLAKNGNGKIDDLLNMVSDAVENARGKTDNKNTGPLHVSNFVVVATDQIEHRMRGIKPENVVPSGYRALDAIITGFSEGDLIVLAARPSMGKTSFSLSLAMKAATLAQRSVLYFSTEQSGLQAAYRMLASVSQIGATKLRSEAVTQEELETVSDACQQICGMSLWIDETSGIGLPQIRARARSFAQKYGRPMIIIDYLQRLAPHRPGDPRLVIGEMTTALKTLARELHAPVIVLAQLNRELEKRASRRPIMSDLAESGKIEQDADIILFLYRDEIYNSETREPGIIEVIVGKNRDGSVGTAKLRFNAATQRFEDLFGAEPQIIEPP